MSRTLSSLALVLALTVPAHADPPRTPPGQAKKKKEDKPGRHRAPPAPEPHMPVREAPVVESFQPEEGAPGALVEIRGKHFDETTRVRFNGRWIAVLKHAPDQLQVRLPPTAVTDRFVVNKTGFADVSADKEFVVVRNPVIASFSPEQGGPGTRVVVAGEHFIPADRFVVGDVEAPVENRRHDRVTIRIPDGARTGKVGVKRGDKVLAWSKVSLEVIGPGPVVDSFSPTQGDAGTVVRITGRNFQPTDTVELNGRKLVIRGRAHDFLEVVIGNHANGQFVVLGPGGRRALSAGTFGVVRPAVIAGFSPAFGSPGTRITIEGQGFLDGDQVYIGGAMLTVRTITDRRIVAELPAGVESGPLHVQRGTRKFGARGRFEVILPPTITEIKPHSAPPGAVVEIRGRFFLPDVSVLLAGQKLKIVARRLPEALEVQVPPDARTGEIVVVTRAGSVRSPFPFTITQHATLASFFPLHALPGSQITLRGASFHPGMKVFLGDRELAVIKLAPESVVVEIPKEAKSGKIRIVTFGRDVVSQLLFTVDEPKPDLEFTFAPTAGPRGSEVTIFVQPPRQGVIVYFEGRPLPKKVLQGGKQIVVTVPGDARTGHFELEYEGRQYRAKQPFKVR